MYYPLSQITVNLYTNGGEYILANSNQPYSGYYWKNSQGQFFTGKTPQDTIIERLIPITNQTFLSTSEDKNNLSYYNQNDFDSINYITLTNPPIAPISPTYSLTIPTQQDYQIGEFRRYFCKKSNEIIYLEISKDTYDKLINQNPQILYQLYQPFNIPWKLIGDKEQVYKTNKNIVELTMGQYKLPQFNKYLKEDYTKYYPFLEGRVVTNKEKINNSI